MKWLKNLFKRRGEEIFDRIFSLNYKTTRVLMRVFCGKRRWLAYALNKFIWKINYKDKWETTTELANYIVAELADIGIKISWDEKEERFY